MEEEDRSMKDNETVVVGMVGCAACHSDGHSDVEFKRLTHPREFKVKVDGEWHYIVATHWALCPTNGEPILRGTVHSL